MAGLMQGRRIRSFSALILRSPPKAGVSKDGAAPWFETRSYAALLTMRPGETEGAATSCQARGGRRRSLNQARYFVIFARCACEAVRLQVATSSLPARAPQRSSTQSFGL
jgi:hypothetical protein